MEKLLKNSLQHFLIGLLWSGVAVFHYWSINGKLHHIFSFFTEASLVLIGGALLYWSIAFFILCKAKKRQSQFLSLQLILSIFLLFVGPHRQVNPFIHWLVFLTYIVIIGGCMSWLCWKFHQKARPILLIFLLTFSASRIYKSILLLNQQWQEYQELKESFSDQSSKDFLEKFRQKDNFKHKLNVYQLSIDAYPNLEGIQRFGIDNSSFYEWLTENGFKTYPNASSNGGETYTSLTMMWVMKMAYPNKGHLISREAYHGKNEVFARLTNQNYTIYCNYPCTTHEKAPQPPVFTNLRPTGEVPIHSFFMRYFLAYYFSNDLIEWFVGSRDAAPQSDPWDYVNSYRSAISNFSPIKKDNLSDGVYLFLHDISNRARLEKTLNEVNLQLKAIIDDITKRDPNSIVIVSSDHGNRIEWTLPYTDTPLHNFGVMQAIRWPKVCDRFNDVELLTGVNFFRYVFACLNGWKEPKHLEPNDGYMGYLSRQGKKHYGTFIGVKDGKFLELAQEVNGKMSQEEIKKLFANAPTKNSFTRKLRLAEAKNEEEAKVLYLCRGTRVCVHAPSEVLYPLEGKESHLTFSYGMRKDWVNQYPETCFEVFLKNQDEEQTVWQDCIPPQEKGSQRKTEVLRTAKVQIPPNIFQSIHFKTYCPADCAVSYSFWGDFKIRKH